MDERTSARPQSTPARPILIALAAAAVQVATVLSVGLTWPAAWLLVLPVTGLAGAVLCATYLDVAAVVLGGAAGLAVGGFLFDPGQIALDQLAVPMAVVTVFGAGVLLAVAVPVFVALRRVGALPVRLAVGAGLIAGVAAAWFGVFGIVLAYPVPIDTYRLLDQHTIVVEVTTWPNAWARVDSVVETATAVRVMVRSSDWLQLGGSAVGRIVELSVHLASPLDGRAVMGADGRQVPLASAP